MRVILFLKKGGVPTVLYNDTTWNRLNRFFNIFNPKVYRYLVLINCFLLTWILYCLYIDKIAVAEWIFAFILVNLLIVPNLLLHCPKKFFFYKGTAEFEDYVSMRPRGIMSTNFWWLKVSYTVTNIQQPEFHQNAFEKLFDVGRVSFSGETTFTAKRDVDRIIPKERHLICGIQHFSDFKKAHCPHLNATQK